MPVISNSAKQAKFSPPSTRLHPLIRAYQSRAGKGQARKGEPLPPVVHNYLRKVGKLGASGGAQSPTKFTSETGRATVQRRWAQARMAEANARRDEAVERARRMAQATWPKVPPGKPAK